VSEWLDLMLEEVARKKREAKEAEEEKLRRAKKTNDEPAKTKDQSK